jgi:hypothetical protein
VGRKRTGAAAPRDRRSVRLAGLGIFTAALATRLLFWQATPDRAWAWTAFYKGDAPLWLEWARALRAGVPFELGLPIHPPGAAYLVSLVWGGGGTGFLRFVWILLGALVPLLVFLAAERSFGLRAAAVAGAWAALSSGLVVLATSIDNETPYLVLAIGSLLFTEDLRSRPRASRVALWSAVNGAACLFRVEHVLFWALALLFFAAGWLRRTGASHAASRTAVAVLFFALPLGPWHLSAWGAIRRFNEEPRRLTPSEERAVSGVEQALAGIPWTPEALRERDRLPAFLRRTASAFVLATVAHRGGREVRGADFDVLDEAFGYRPRPLRAHPFVSSYGPLNFALANNARAGGGFDRALLEAPPPLAGGAGRYPAFLVRGLPPERLTFVYPPHLELFNEGYAIGGRWIAEHPGDFVRLAAKKLAIFASGAAAGLTGGNLPMGLSGDRRPVDMVAPDPDLASIAWWTGVALLAVAGLVAGRRNPSLAPWLLFLATRVAVSILFFGYVRQGASAIPAVAVLVALAVERGIRRRPLSLATVALAAGIAFEAARFLVRPVVTMDSRPVASSDPFPPDDHAPHRIDVRSR